MLLGHRLAAVRAQTGLTQGEFAESLGLSLRAYANYERGEREVPTALVQSVRQTYGIDSDWLMFGPGDEPRKAAARMVDVDLLEAVVAALQVHLGTSRRLKPKQYAQVVRALYMLSVEHGRLSCTSLSEVVRMAVGAHGR